MSIGEKLLISVLQEATKKRAENTDMLHECKNFSCSDWMLALQEEVGELASLLKKDRLGVEIAHRDRLGAELSDIIITTLFLAIKMNINMSEELVKKFNLSSEKFKSTIMLHKDGSHWYYYRPSPIPYSQDEREKHMEDRRKKAIYAELKMDFDSVIKYSKENTHQLCRCPICKKLHVNCSCTLEQKQLAKCSGCENYLDHCACLFEGSPL